MPHVHSEVSLRLQVCVSKKDVIRKVDLKVFAEVLAALYALIMDLKAVRNCVGSGSPDLTFEARL